MVIIQDIYLTASEVTKLTDKSFTIVKPGQYKGMKQNDDTEVKKLVLPIKLSNEKIRDWIPNKTSIKRLIELYDDDTDKWVGKKATFEIVKQNVRGEMKDVVFVK